MSFGTPTTPLPSPQVPSPPHGPQPMEHRTFSLHERLVHFDASFTMGVVTLIVTVTLVGLAGFVIFQSPGLIREVVLHESMFTASAAPSEGDAVAGRSDVEDSLQRLRRAFLLLVVGWSFGVVLATVLKKHTAFADASYSAYILMASLVVGTIVGFIAVPILQQYRNEKLRLKLVGSWERIDDPQTQLEINQWHVFVNGRPGTETFQYNVSHHRLLLTLAQAGHELSYEHLANGQLLLHAPFNDAVVKRLAGKYRKRTAAETPDALAAGSSPTAGPEERPVEQRLGRRPETSPSLERTENTPATGQRNVIPEQGRR